LVALGGCGGSSNRSDDDDNKEPVNALVGSWESDGAVVGCAEGGTFTIQDNALRGVGQLTLSDGVGCFTCTFDVQGTSTSTTGYDLALTFDTCTVATSDTLGLLCTHASGRLACEPEDPQLTPAIIEPYDDWIRTP
jgi:hypothetical protein